MIQRSCYLIVSVVFLVCPFLTCAETTNWNRRPFGLKMCKDLCHQRAGCSSFGFDDSELICVIPGVTPKSLPSNMLNVSFRVKEGGNNFSRACSSFLRIVHSKTKGFACIPSKSSKEKSKKESSKPRLILSPYEDDRSQALHQFYPHNQSLLPYRFLTVSYVIALYYMSSKKKILLSKSNPPCIMSCTINVPIFDKLKYRKSTNAFAADEGRKLVFLVIERHIARITFGKRGIKTFRSFSNCRKLYSLSVDPNRKMVFIPCPLQLIVFSYDGQIKEILHQVKEENTILNVVCFDIVESYLYRVIKKKSLIENSIVDVTNLGFVPLSLQCFNNKLYVASMRYGIKGIGVINKKDSSYSDLKVPEWLPGFIFTLAE